MKNLKPQTNPHWRLMRQRACTRDTLYGRMGGKSQRITLLTAANASGPHDVRKYSDLRLNDKEFLLLWSRRAKSY